MCLPLRSQGRSGMSGTSHMPSQACAQGDAQQCPGPARAPMGLTALPCVTRRRGVLRALAFAPTVVNEDHVQQTSVVMNGKHAGRAQ